MNSIWTQLFGSIFLPDRQFIVSVVSTFVIFPTDSFIISNQVERGFKLVQQQSDTCWEIGYQSWFTTLRVEFLLLLLDHYTIFELLFASSQKTPEQVFYGDNVIGESAVKTYDNIGPIIEHIYTVRMRSVSCLLSNWHLKFF